MSVEGHYDYDYRAGARDDLVVVPDSLWRYGSINIAIRDAKEWPPCDAILCVTLAPDAWRHELSIPDYGRVVLLRQQKPPAES